MRSFLLMLSLFSEFWWFSDDQGSVLEWRKKEKTNWLLTWSYDPKALILCLETEIRHRKNVCTRTYPFVEWKIMGLKGVSKEWCSGCYQNAFDNFIIFNKNYLLFMTYLTNMLDKNCFVRNYHLRSLMYYDM